MNLKNLLTRAGTGIIYILVILIGILCGRYSFLVVFGITLVISLFEFYRMMEKDTSHDISKIFNILSGLFIYVAAFLYLEQISQKAFPLVCIIYFLVLIVSSIAIRREDIFHSIIYSVFGQIYITLSLCVLMLFSYSFSHETGTITGYNKTPILALFVFLWVNDTAAYFIGSLIGKHKLMEHISPKKSTEGFFAGIFFTLIASLIFARTHPEFSILFWLGFALIVSVVGTLGDLFESLLKRTCNVKDAGNLIPGHGGILDRIDSLLIATPAVYLYLILTLSL